MTTKYNIVLDVDETLIKGIIYPNEYIDYIKRVDPFIKTEVLDTHPELKNIIDNNIDENESFMDLLFLTSFIINDHTYIIFMRPYLRDFLTYINEKFNIHIYSLGTQNYIVNILDSIVKYIGFNPFQKVIANTEINKFKKKYLTLMDLPSHNTLIIDDRNDVWTNDNFNLYNIIPFNKPYELINDEDDDDNEFDLTFLNIKNIFKLSYMSSVDMELYNLIQVLKNYFKNNIEFNIYKFKSYISYKNMLK
jgi:TFIIF-interacting CTD phosphatase-like protein